MPRTGAFLLWLPYLEQHMTWAVRTEEQAYALLDAISAGDLGTHQPMYYQKQNAKREVISLPPTCPEIMNLECPLDGQPVTSYGLCRRHAKRYEKRPFIYEVEAVS